MAGSLAFRLGMRPVQSDAMSLSTRPRLRFALDRLGGMALVALVVGLWALWPERGLDAVGPVALRDAVLSAAHCLARHSIAGAAGRSLAQSFLSPSLTALEAIVFTVMPSMAVLGLTNLDRELVTSLNRMP